jgi:hypothetical protein
MTTKHPRLRSHTRRGKNGQVWTWYTYDMRPEGGTEISLGKDYAAALQQWEHLHNKAPALKGRIQEAINRWRTQELPLYDSAETRRGYTKSLKHLEPVFGQAAWWEVTLLVLRQYLDRRTGKTQANRELALLSIIWNKARLWGMTDKPWPATGIKGWKNKEHADTFEVTDALFDAVYAQADQVLRDCMDITTATGMRLTDARTVRLPVAGQLHFKASKGAKRAYFDVATSPVLTALVARRAAQPQYSVMLLTTPTGRQVSQSMLRYRFDEARLKAIAAHPELASELKAMKLRYMRKRAADLATDTQAASSLLQHSSTKLTETHYRTRPAKLQSVR